nr:hypothetical protein [Roseovarius sp. EL26]
MKLNTFLFCFLALSETAQAESFMTAQEFETYTEGKTFYYGSGGNAYGAEEYLKNRRVRWSFLDGECQEGTWYPDGDLICFLYDESPNPQCWSFVQSGNGMIAQFENDPASTTLYEVDQSADPLLCLGPKIGV